LGNGSQGIHWIRTADEVAGIRGLMKNENKQGIFNLPAPEPLSNTVFRHILAKEMGRPFWVLVPALALRLTWETVHVGT